MTEMPVERAAHAAIAPPQPRGVAARLREAADDLALLAARPRLIAGLHGLASRAEGLARQGSGPQPAPFPQGTGPFAPARALGIGELFPPAPVPADDHDHDHDRSM